MTSPLCPPCSRLHELVREWAKAHTTYARANDTGVEFIEWARLFNARGRAIESLLEAAQQLPDAAAHCPDMPAWISIADYLPSSGDDVLVFTKEYGVQIDRWRMQREAPVSFSTVTIETGEMWDSHTFEEVSHWMPIPPTPTERCPAGSPQTDHGAAIAACAQQDRYPLLYALIQSGADVCAAIEAVLESRA